MIDALAKTNKPAADRVESLMNKALHQFYRSEITAGKFRAILSGIGVGDLTVLHHHFSEGTDILPSSIN